VRSFLALQRCFRLADRAGRDPRAPPGWVLGRPVGDVEVERADGEQVVQGVDPRRGGLADPPVTVCGPGDLGGDALLHPFATSAGRRSESMPGWLISRSRQNSLPRL